MLFELFGWIGSGLIILSLMQSSVLRFRILNLAGAVISTIYNAAIGVWPFATMNAIITVIDIYWLWRLISERHDASIYEVVEVGIDDAYLIHLLGRHRAEIEARHEGMRLAEVVPSMAGPGPTTAMAAPHDGAAWDRTAFLVLREDETVGMLVLRDAGQGVGMVELDHVTPRFREFTPGEFVYQRSGVFAERGFRRLVVADSVAEGDYYSRLGFAHVEGRWELEVQPAAA